MGHNRARPDVPSRHSQWAGCRSAPTSLQPIRADNIAGAQALHHEEIADLIEWVGVQQGVEGFVEPFVEFEIEDVETQRLRGTNVLGRVRQACHIGLSEIAPHRRSRAGGAEGASGCGDDRADRRSGIEGDHGRSRCGSGHSLGSPQRTRILLEARSSAHPCLRGVMWLMRSRSPAWRPRLHTGSSAQPRYGHRAAQLRIGDFQGRESRDETPQ